MNVHPHLEQKARDEALAQVIESESLNRARERLLVKAWHRCRRSCQHFGDNVIKQ